MIVPVELRDSDLNPLNPNPQKCQNRHFECNDRKPVLKASLLVPPQKVASFIFLNA